MLKRSPGRTQRSKGVNVKHVLQILLLLGVCFWLVYQIKHSHDKKKEYDEKESKVSGGTQTGVENYKLGRKDLPHEEVTMSEKPVEEEEEESRGDDEDMKRVEEGQEESKREEDDEEENKPKELDLEKQNKLEVDEQEELDNKGVVAEDEGNDDINEHDQEKIEETEHDDEEKEREDRADEEGGGRDSEDKEGNVEIENSSDDQDLDASNLNNHEAREEHYKADDASSAVSHDTQTIGSASQKGTLEDQKQNLEKGDLEGENQSSKDTEVLENSKLRLGEGVKADNGTSLVFDSSKRRGDESGTTERGDNSISNLTLMSSSNNQPVVGNSSLEMSTEASKNSVSTMDASGSFVQNVTEIANSSWEQNATSDIATVGRVSNSQTAELEQANYSTSISDIKQSDSTVSTGIENADATASDSSNSEANVVDDIVRSETIDGSEISSGSLSTTKENLDVSQIEKSNSNNESGGVNEDSGISGINETADGIQHEAIDSSLAEEIGDIRVDLDTLPDITTGENNIEDAAAE